MRFSISSSRAIAVALLAGLVLLGVLEMAARAAITRISRTERRIYEEGQLAVSIKARSREGVPNLLFVGNSLLLSDLDFLSLSDNLQGVIAPSQYAIENTAYLDWLYGLRRLQNEGSRPATVCLTLSLDQLLMDSVRGEYFAHRLMRPQDTLDVMADAGLDRTQASNLFLARFSAWLGTKTEIRKLILSRLLPFSSDVLMRIPAPRAAALGQREAVVQKIADRLRRFRAVMDSQGTRSCLLTPPVSTDTPERYSILEEGSGRAGVLWLAPVWPGTYEAGLYADGLHLTAEGRGEFTKALVGVLGGNPPNP
jgi:hypothetical protein